MPNRAVRLLVLTVVAGSFAAVAFAGARKIARQSRKIRRRIMWLTGVGCAAAIFLIWWVPYHLPASQSAAGIVILLVTWITGGAFLVLGGGSFLGAATAPNDEA